jgi:ABC-type phosphate/phosphonate transport system substrate-binding protein
MRRLMALALIAVMALGVIGFAQDLGTRDNPIRWLFVQSQEPDYLLDIAQRITAEISQATGLYIDSRVLEYQAFIEDFVAAEGDVMGVPTTQQYITIADRTNFQATPALMSVRNDMPYYYTAIYALREYGYTSVYDLQGKVWAYPHEGSTSGYKLPKQYFDGLGITFGGVLPSGDGSHQRGLLNVLDKQADFCTGFWNPGQPPAYILAGMKEQPGYVNYWFDGWDPELWIWDYWNQALYPEQIRGTVEDLRQSVGDMYADGSQTYGDKWVLADLLQVIGLVGPIPNDCFAFSVGFPQDLQDIIVAAIKVHIGSPASPGPGHALWSDTRFYKWTEVMEVNDSVYNNYRRITGQRVNED